MDAKEYLESRNITVRDWGMINYGTVIGLMNDFHQAESKEKLEITDQDKIKMCIKRYPNMMLEGFNGADIRQAYFRGINDMLTAFGKEGS